MLACERLPTHGIRSAQILSRKMGTYEKRDTSRRDEKLGEKMIDSSNFKSVMSSQLRKLSQIFEENEYELRIAGGAVRDILMGRDPNDIDLATTATPEQMKKMFEEKNIRMINNKGESHGTITARIEDMINFEVTTLRIDKITDGRHAEVDFTTDWRVDAGRRDLTINAMFLGLDGRVYDYFDGQTDLKMKRIRFVGDPAQRIKEDYLRILRYFRFYGRFSEHPREHEESTLLAIKENAKGLANISGERIWMELNKIIVGNHAPDVMETMMECGVLQYCGLPETPCIDRFRSSFERILKEYGKSTLHPAASVACLLKSKEQVEAVVKRLRVSRLEMEMMNYIIVMEEHAFAEKEYDIQFFKKRFLLDGGKVPKMKMILVEVMRLQNSPESTIREFETWTPPRFPIRGHILGSQWDVRGPKIGKCMQELREEWIESGMTITEEELMSSKMRDKVLDKLFNDKR